MNYTDLLAARAAFVKMIKGENFFLDYSKQSLRAHWNGAKSGFADDMVQHRWHDFYAGWKAKSERPTSPQGSRTP